MSFQSVGLGRSGRGEEGRPVLPSGLFEWVGRVALRGAPRVRLAAVVAVVVLAAAVRFAAARRAYPVPGDGANFVLVGVESAEGTSRLWAYWSQGMTWLAAVAHKLGVSPPRVLQSVSLAAGVVAVAALIWLGRLVLGEWRRAVVAGLLAAVNPTMVQYSIAGYSEMPFVALMLTALAVGYAGLLRDRGRGSLLVALAGLLLGAGAYFKGADAGVMGLAALAWGTGVCAVRRASRSVLGLGLGLMVFLAASAPLLRLTREQTGGLTGLGAKALNIVSAHFWDDSKAIYGLVKPWAAEQQRLCEQGLLRFMLSHRQMLARRAVRNAVQALRLFSEAYFTGPFRMGTGWFVLLGAAGAYVVWKAGRLGQLALPGLLLAAHVGALSLFLVHLRLLVPSIALGFLVGAEFFFAFYRGAAARAMRAGLGVALAMVLFRYALLSMDAARREPEWWRYPHMAEVGRKLRDYGRDEDVIMAQGPHIALHFHERHTLRAVELPYASLAEVEQHAAAQGVRFIVVSSHARPHWPVAELFRGASPPPNWELLAELSFAEDGELSYPAEAYRIYRRSDP